MAIVKFITSGCPMSNIFSYVTNKEKTDDKLISGVNCMPETAFEEFKFVKNHFHKEDGRQYYHIVQSFNPEDNLSPQTAHEIGLRFAEYFPDYQILVATHIDKDHIHNHLVMNSVSFKDGKKFHQSRDEMLAAKRYSNQLCREYGLSTTEVKSSYSENPKWKQLMRNYIEWALRHSATKEDFIENMEMHGYDVKWNEGHKYITFTDKNGHVCRDNKLFDERFLRNNLEVYFALGGCKSELCDKYMDYETPPHPEHIGMTVSMGLITILGNLLTSNPNQNYYTPRPLAERDWMEIEMLEEILGKRIEPVAFACYSTRAQYAQAMGLDMGMYM